MTVKLLLTLVLANLIAACSTITYYQAPPDLTPATGSYVVGSKTESPGALESDTRAYITRIDGVYSRSVGSSYGVPQLVSAGKHQLNVGVSFAGRFGFINVDIETAPGRTYTFRATRDGPYNGFLWVEDDLGNIVVGKTLVTVSAPVNTGPIFIPLK